MGDTSYNQVNALLCNHCVHTCVLACLCAGMCEPLYHCTPVTHMHTHTHTQTLTHAHTPCTHLHAHTHTPNHTHSQTPTHPTTHTHRHPPTQPHTRTHTDNARHPWSQLVTVFLGACIPLIHTCSLVLPHAAQLCTHIQYICHTCPCIQYTHSITVTSHINTLPNHAQYKGIHIGKT